MDDAITPSVAIGTTSMTLMCHLERHTAMSSASLFVDQSTEQYIGFAYQRLLRCTNRHDFTCRIASLISSLLFRVFYSFHHGQLIYTASNDEYYFYIHERNGHQRRAHDRTIQLQAGTMSNLNPIHHSSC